MIVGLPVRYTVISGLAGVFAATQMTFAATITQINDDGTCDLTFFPPCREPNYAAAVAQSSDGTDAPGTWSHIREQHLDESPDETAPLTISGGTIVSSGTTDVSSGATVSSGGTSGTDVSSGATVSSGGEG